MGFRMSATCFVQPLDLVKTRMQMSGMYAIITCFQGIIGVIVSYTSHTKEYGSF